jgi:putative ABC transport system substrate-binding protein
MRRRDLFGLLGGLVAAWPIAGHGQQPERVRRIGVLIAWPENSPAAQTTVTAFSQALGHLGWVEGKNIQIDYRFAADPTLLQRDAAELIAIAPDAILASTTPATAALRGQTRTIPLVFVNVLDPVGQGFVQSLAHPGGNITGFSAYDAPIMGKWVQLLREVAPRVTRVAVIFNPDTTPYARSLNRTIEAAAATLGMTVTLAPVRDDAEIEKAIAAQAHEPGGGLISLPDIFTTSHRDPISAAASGYGLPLIGIENVPRSGGLMSYWYDTLDMTAQAATYIDRILKGANPAELPVQQPTKFKFVINMKTATAIGLTVPPSLLARADEVIE